MECVDLIHAIFSGVTLLGLNMQLIGDLNYIASYILCYNEIFVCNFDVLYGYDIRFLKLRKEHELLK
jgi:hypothetical protein